MLKPGFEQRSGRVISLGRFMLAGLFLLAIWLDASQPAQAETETYGLLVGYVVIALALVLGTWNDWWLDARLAGPAHLLDVLIFTGLVFSTEGYTSPFFLFFVFLLLSAAIRWSWRETALTAVALVILYLSAGLIVATSPDFQLERFITRSSHLVILSAILIWFGVNQSFSAPLANHKQFAPVSPDEPPLESALKVAARVGSASRACMAWHDVTIGNSLAFSLRENEIATIPDAQLLIRRAPSEGPFLYDLKRNRAVARDPMRQIVFGEARDWLWSREAERLQLGEGLAVPFGGEGGQGELFLEGIRSLSIDHLELGLRLAAEIADHLRRHALLRAVEESGEARARLSLARDLHDSVVQFLASATFRTEAMMRQSRSGLAVDDDLQELKRLMLQEQDDLRSFIGALRSGHAVNLRQLADELQLLAGKLARQWDIDCAFSAEVERRLIPMRLHLDALQLVRETVANAVRHGNASSIRIHLAEEDDCVRLDLQDNGSGFPAAMTLSTGSEDLQPLSLKERVKDAGGELMLATLAHGTSVSITLPIRGRQ